VLPTAPMLPAALPLPSVPRPGVRGASGAPPAIVARPAAAVAPGSAFTRTPPSTRRTSPPATAGPAAAKAPPKAPAGSVAGAAARGAAAGAGGRGAGSALRAGRAGATRGGAAGAGTGAGGAAGGGAARGGGARRTVIAGRAVSRTSVGVAADRGPKKTSRSQSTPTAAEIDHAPTSALASTSGGVAAGAQPAGAGRKGVTALGPRPRASPAA
jgi:hypothetical protein